MSKITDAIKENRVFEKRKNSKNPAYAHKGFIQKLLDNERIELQYGNANHANHNALVRNLQAGYFNNRNRFR